MNMKFFLVRSALLLVLLIPLSQCKSSRQVQTGFYPEKKLIIDNNFRPPETGDNGFEIYEVSIKGDALHLFVRYRAGDGLDDFDLISNGLYTKTYPPMVPLYLMRRPSGAERTKMVMQELIFDVRAARQFSDDQIIFRLVGYPNVIIYRK